MKKLYLILVLLFLITSPIRAIATEQPIGRIVEQEVKMPLAVYNTIVENFGNVIKKEFQEDSFKNLKFKKGTTVTAFAELPQLEKDLFILQQAQAFSSHLNKFEKKCCQDLIDFMPSEPNSGLPTKSELLKIINNVHEIQKTQNEQVLIFVDELIERNKIDKTEAKKLKETIK